MDMSLEDTLAALGLDDEVTVSPRTGRDRGGNFSLYPAGGLGVIERTQHSRRGRLRLPLAPSGVTWTLSVGRRAHQGSQ